MPPRKSIYRGPNAQHFQLVHRSVRDPLINDPEASQQVFKPVERANDATRKTGFTLAELEGTVDRKNMRDNEGEAALYGITYDDSKYDYMSHLREIGQGGAESVLLPAPRGSGVARGMKPGHDRPKGKGKAKEEDMFVMPQSVMASEYEISLQEAYASQQAIPPELQGLQPDMDPHLRQVLEALDDDAFVDEAGDDEDWFDELLDTGEVEYPEDREEFEFREWGVPEEGEGEEGGEGGDEDETRTEQGDKEETWEDRFKAFKAAGGRHAVQRPPSELDDAERSEMADTIGSLASNLGDMMVVGGKKRRGKRGPSDASGMSMSSSSMWRNSELRTLDDRFDKIEREYEMEDDEDDDFPDDDDVSIAPSYMSSASRASSLFSRASAAPPEITRDDFDAIMDDFLENYEIVGNRMRESLGATNLTGAEKLQVLRSALEDGDEGLNKEENKRRILAMEKMERRGKVREEKEKLPMKEIIGEKEHKWDVETIISTYTNTDNHPGMIRSRTAAQMKARAERAAAAEAAAAATAAQSGAQGDEDDENEDDSGSETEREGPKVTVSRPKGESSEDRKNRKAAVKAERSARRAEKKHHKETFGTERKRQLASHKKLVGDGRAADLSVASNRVVSLS